MEPTRAWLTSALWFEGWVVDMGRWVGGWVGGWLVEVCTYPKTITRFFWMYCICSSATMLLVPPSFSLTLSGEVGGWVGGWVE